MKTPGQGQTRANTGKSRKPMLINTGVSADDVWCFSQILGKSLVWSRSVEYA